MSFYFELKKRTPYAKIAVMMEQSIYPHMFYCSGTSRFYLAYNMDSDYDKNVFFGNFNNDKITQLQRDYDNYKLTSEYYYATKQQRRKARADFLRQILPLIVAENDTEA